jgi:sortase A
MGTHSIKQENQEAHLNNLSKILKIGGLLLILLSLLLLAFIYKDIFLAEVDYALDPGEDDKQVVLEKEGIEDTSEKIIVLDKEFGIYIPKIKADASVIKNVNPYDAFSYNKALEKGVAHAITSSVPNQGGNTFLFAHSAIDFYESRNYNIYFYLLDKLTKGDKVYVSYKEAIYEYEVTDVSIVNRDQVSYLQADYGKDTLTLMTCWPNGTDWKRVIVEAKKVENTPQE